MMKKNPLKLMAKGAGLYGKDLKNFVKKKMKEAADEKAEYNKIYKKEFRKEKTKAIKQKAKLDAKMKYAPKKSSEWKPDDAFNDFVK